MWIAQRRFPLFAGGLSGAGARLSLWSWAASFTMHVALFLPASLAWGRNINYMTAPPGSSGPKAKAAIDAFLAANASARGLGLAEALAGAAAAGLTGPDLRGLLYFGSQHYRKVMGAFCALLPFLMSSSGEARAAAARVLCCVLFGCDMWLRAIGRGGGARGAVPSRIVPAGMNVDMGHRGDDGVADVTRKWGALNVGACVAGVCVCVSGCR